MYRIVSIFLILLFNFIKINAQSWDELIRIEASNKISNGGFGNAVSISGDYAIVGASGENGTNPPYNLIGLAYILKRDNNGEWNELQKIYASDGEPLDYFAWDVDISGDFAIVGATGAGHFGADGIIGPGAAYIFERNSNDEWVEKQKLIALDVEGALSFGSNVRISGNYAIISAIGEDEDELGLDSLKNAGAAYIFERDSLGNWNEKQKIVASDRDVSDRFGTSVSICDDYVIVGAGNESENEVGLNMINRSGSVYIFKRDSVSEKWIEIQKIKASDRRIDDHFGSKVSLSENHMIIGTNGKDVYIGSNILYSAGAAYIFEKDIDGLWNEKQILVASDVATSRLFGLSVVISDKYAMVGDFDFSWTNNSNILSSTYVFERDSIGIWREIQKLDATERGPGDHFGNNIAISGENAIIGAGGTKEIGDGTNAYYTEGSAYIFVRDSLGTINYTNNDSTLNIELKPIKPINIITPNEDGINDYFKIENEFGYKLTIYNRWGNKVFHSNYYDNKFKGEELIDGVYYYSILFKNQSESYKGWFQILR